MTNKLLSFLFFYLFSLVGFTLNPMGNQLPPMPPTTPGATETTPTSMPGMTKPTPEPSMPTLPPSPPVEFKQAKWPEAVELSEQTKGIVQVGWKKDFGKYLKEAKNITDQVRQILSEIRKKREDLYNKYKDKETKLDPFFQDISFKQGKMEQKVKELLQTEQN